MGWQKKGKGKESKGRKKRKKGVGFGPLIGKGKESVNWAVSPNYLWVIRRNQLGYFNWYTG